MSLTLQTHLQNHDNDDEEEIREIHALTPLPPPPAARSRWETNSHHRSSSLSTYSETASSENFTSMSREFNALVLAGSSIENNANTNSPSTGIGNNSNNQLSRIGENDVPTEEINHLAIVPDNSPLLDLIPEQRRTESVTGTSAAGSASVGGGIGGGEVSVLRVKKEEVDSKILAWQNAKVAKINNRFKREDAIINGWESEQVQKATSWMKKVERKLEEKRARALEKMQNDVAKARQKAEERRASAEAKRGTKVARVLELANLMKAVGRAPGKRSFF